MAHSSLHLPNIEDLEEEDAKQLLRAAVREHRRQRSEKSRQDLSQLWISTVLDFLGDAKTVAGFVSTEFEPQTFDLCTMIADSGKQLLLPKLGPGLTRSWGFFGGRDDLTQMAPGRPPEPTGPAFDNEVLASVDALIMPALLVSRFGERLGQGGGWYDRALKAAKPGTRIGAMIYPEEYVDFRLPQNDLDMLIPYVLLPKQIITTTIAA